MRSPRFFPRSRKPAPSEPACECCTDGVSELRLNQQGSLVITLRRATGLRRADVRVLGGSSDPYAVVAAAGGAPATSSTVKSSLSPTWEETLRLAGGIAFREVLRHPLTVTIMDRDTKKIRELLSSSDDVLGTVSASLLPALADEDAADLVLPLSPPGRGTVYLRVEWRPAAVTFEVWDSSPTAQPPDPPVEVVHRTTGAGVAETKASLLEASLLEACYDDAGQDPSDEAPEDEAPASTRQYGTGCCICCIGSHSQAQRIIVPCVVM